MPAPLELIRTLVVDDEPPGRKRLVQLLRQEPDVELISECSNGEEAITAIRRDAPDLVLLDVQMPGLSGFDVIRAVGPGAVPAVVFVTAFDHHALAAFEVHALDYLLKPFKPSRFHEMIERVRALLRRRGGEDDVSRRLRALLDERKPAVSPTARLAVRTSDRVIFLRPEEIDWAESAGNYVALHVGKETHIMRETLTNLEAQLPAERFLRLGRSALVNTDRVRELHPVAPGENIVVLRDGTRLTATRGLRELQEQLRGGW